MKPMFRFFMAAKEPAIFSLIFSPAAAADMLLLNLQGSMASVFIYDLYASKTLPDFHKLSVSAYICCQIPCVGPYC